MVQPRIPRESRVQFDTSKLNTWMETTRTAFDPGTMVSEQGLIENTHYQVDYAGGRIKLLNLAGVVDPGIVSFRFTGDSRASLPDPPAPPDYGPGTDVLDPSGTNLADGVAALRAYLALPSPTQAQTVSALKLLIRAVLFLIRRLT
jgi:hypothetical protein